jgi:hypothetical protein
MALWMVLATAKNHRQTTSVGIQTPNSVSTTMRIGGPSTTEATAINQPSLFEGMLFLSWALDLKTVPLSGFSF